MNNKEKIKRLKQYIEFTKEHKQLIESFEEYKSKIYQPSIQILTDMPKSQNQGNEKMDNCIITLLEYEDKLHNMLIDLNKTKNEIESIINNINESSQRMILKYRYIDGYNFENICTKMNYTWRHTHRLHSKALQKINF